MLVFRDMDFHPARNMLDSADIMKTYVSNREISCESMQILRGYRQFKNHWENGPGGHSMQKLIDPSLDLSIKPSTLAIIVA